MPYTPFVDSKPVGTDTGTEAINYIRQNLMAMRDAVVMGAMIDWDFSKSGGTAEEPAIILYTKGVERLRVSLTWGTSGGEDGNVKVALWEYSSNSGTNYDTVGTQTMTYDASGNPSTAVWS